MDINSAVANGRVGRVLARPIIAPEETTPKKLTFAIVLSFTKRPMFTAFFGTVLPEIFARVLFLLYLAVGVGPRKLSARNFLRTRKF